MSKIERFQGNVRAFASDAQGMERTVFGGTNQADDLTSQITASFLRGWGIVGASEHPSLEDFNAAMYAMSQFIAYQHQMGVAEWHAQQEYHIGSICTHNGESYQSLQDANIGNEPPSSNWTPVLTSKNGLSNLGLGDAAKMDAATLDITSNSLVAKIPVLFLGEQRALIIQASSLSSSSTSGTIVFPAAFPNACIVALTHDYSSTGTDLSNVKFNVPSQTSVNWYAQNMGTGSTSTPPSSWGWLAIGW